MPRRYIAFLANGPAAYTRWKARLADCVSDVPALGLTIDSTALVVSSESRWIRLGDDGILLGEVIRNDGNAPIRSLDPSESRAIIKSRGARLLSDFWGAYLALLPDDDGGITILRAPLGDLPVYTLRSPSGLVIASDVDLLRRIGGYQPSVDWTGVAEHLVAPDLRRSRTCLAEIGELSGGQRGRWHEGDWSIDDVWSPWSAVARNPMTVDPGDAADMLATTVLRSVDARLSRFGSLLVLVSGGLDSSIVAACVAHTGQSVSALTMVTQDRGGDERKYAETTTSHLSMPLAAVGRDPADIALLRSHAAGLPRPSERSFAQATHAAADATARQTGAEAIIHGGGGDNVFCSVQSAAPLTDRLIAGGFDWHCWNTARDIAMLAETSIARVIWHAIRRMVRRNPAYRAFGDYTLLSNHGVAAASCALDHPWLQPPGGAMPGSAAHIGLVAAAQSLVESPDPRLDVPWIAPLIAQPIIEACVSIPSWNWYDRGSNRAVARHAFERRLPGSIAWRRSKGAMDSFVIEIFENNRSAISELLRDGLLVGNGIIDRRAVAAVLDEPGLTRGHRYARVMQFVDVEVWARSWATN